MKKITILILFLFPLLSIAQIEAGSIDYNNLENVTSGTISGVINTSSEITIENANNFVTGAYTPSEPPFNFMPATLKVLILSNDWSASDVQVKLLGSGRFLSVDIFYLNNGNPTLAFLNTYNAVFFYTNGVFYDQIASGNELAQYLEGGGGVVDATFTGNIPLLGAWTNYSLYSNSSQNSHSTRTLGTVNTPGSPVMMNVNSFNGGIASYYNNAGIISPGSVIEANYDNGQPLVITKINVGPANAKRVFLNFFPPSIDVNPEFWVPSTDGVTLMANALEWVAAPIIDLPPTAICQDIIVQLNAAGTVTIVATDIDNGSTDNIGIASYSIDIDTFTCADVGVGGPVTVTLTVTDAAGNSDTCTATITVEDNIDPVITCPADITVNNDTGVCGAVVTYAVTATDNCGAGGGSCTTEDFEAYVPVGSAEAFPGILMLDELQY